MSSDFVDYLDIMKSGGGGCDMVLSSQMVEYRLAGNFVSRYKASAFLVDSFMYSKKKGLLGDLPMVDRFCYEVKAGAIIGIPSSVVYECYRYRLKTNIYFSQYFWDNHRPPTGVSLYTMCSRGDSEWLVKFKVLDGKNCCFLGPVV